jgi:hypothetical protein
VSEYTLTVDDLKTLGEKLDNAGLTEAEKAFLSAAVDLAAQSAAGGDEVEGFDFASRRYAMTAFANTSLSVGFGNSFKPFGTSAAPNAASALGARSIILVGG